MKKMLLLVLVLMLAACTTSGSEFDQNKAKWEDANISHYKFDLWIGCFCAFRSQMPLTIEVQDGKVVSMTDVNGEAITAESPSYEIFSTYETIDRLFVKLAADISAGADEITVSYDPIYGFPVTTYIDYIHEAADDELSIEVQNFEVLK